ncbi:MAG: 2-hydroxyacyl-CoA dehydratase family protein [Pseudomonadota bacterium]
MGRLAGELREKRIGWLCSFVPEELILAAGLQPIRLKGQADRVREADGYVFSNLCPYVKNLLDSGLRLKFNDLDGIVFANSCDGMRRLYDLWTNYVSTPFTYMLEIPRNTNEYALLYFEECLVDLKNRLEGTFGVKITDKKIGQAISLMNDHRKWVAQIFENQKEAPPRYYGSELLSILSSEGNRPKNETTALLKDFADRPAGALPNLKGQPRILVMGNVLDRPALFEIIEKVKCSIVLFDSCNGLRHYADLVEDSSSPLKALARRYLLKPSCDRMPGFEARLERIGNLIREYDVQGVICSGLKFCDYTLFETPEVEKLLKDMGLPFLVLENDYVLGDIERIRTRVEAFQEMIRSSMD